MSGSGGGGGGGKKKFFLNMFPFGKRARRKLKQQQQGSGQEQLGTEDRATQAGEQKQQPEQKPSTSRFDPKGDFDATEFEFGQTYEHRGNVQGVYYSYLAAEEFGSPYVQSREAFTSSSLSLEYTERDVVMPDRDARFSLRTLVSRTRSTNRRRDSVECGSSSGGGGGSRRCSEVDVEQIRATLFPVEPQESQFQATQELAQLVRDISEEFSRSASFSSDANAQQQQQRGGADVAGMKEESADEEEVKRSKDRDVQHFFSKGSSAESVASVQGTEKLSEESFRVEEFPPTSVIVHCSQAVSSQADEKAVKKTDEGTCEAVNVTKALIFEQNKDSDEDEIKYLEAQPVASSERSNEKSKMMAMDSIGSPANREEMTTLPIQAADPLRLQQPAETLMTRRRSQSESQASGVSKPVESQSLGRQSGHNGCD